MSLLVSLFHFLNSSKHTEKEASMHSMKFEKKKTPTQCNVTKTVTLASSFLQLESSSVILFPKFVVNYRETGCILILLTT